MKHLLVALLFVVSFAARAAGPQITPAELSREIAARVSKVDEFDFIRKKAQEMGVRVYLFGGTAAGFAHYVKWDLQRERGDVRFQPDRFDYDYTNIYRSNQDLDIVVDGTSKQADEMERAIRERFDYVRGGRGSKWEVRLLRSERNGKIPLLKNPDFLNQHTDSNSTGMVELTATEPADAVRDLRDWNSRTSQFLVDVAEGKIHYYDSDKHSTTSYFKAGENPPIFSVIRYLTKVFQYELEMRPEDVQIIKARIGAFRADDLKSYRAATIFDRLGAKLLQNPVNMEYAFETVEALGLKKILKKHAQKSTETGSLAWWIEKSPLGSKPVGQGRGKTARALGIDVVAHETNSYQAWESITLAPTGEPNVLESRSSHGHVGELAAFGDGFYTRKGRVGARGTGLTIRFRLNPEAREGSDFKVAADDYVIMLNKSAFTVVPDGLDMSIVDFFEVVSRGEKSDLGSEKAMMEKLRRRMAKYTSEESLKPEDLARLDKLMGPRGKLRLAMAQVEGVATEFFSFPFSKRYRSTLEKLVADPGVSTAEIAEILLHPLWASDAALIEGAVRKRLAMIQKRQIYSYGTEFARLLWLKVAQSLRNGTVDDYKAAFARFSKMPDWMLVFQFDFAPTFRHLLEERDVAFRRQIGIALVANVKTLDYDVEEYEKAVREHVLAPLRLEGDPEILRARIGAGYVSALTVDLVANAPSDVRDALIEALFAEPRLDPRSNWKLDAALKRLGEKIVGEDPAWPSKLMRLEQSEVGIDLVDSLFRGMSKGRREIYVSALLKEGSNEALVRAIDLQRMRDSKEGLQTALAFLKAVGSTRRELLDAGANKAMGVYVQRMGREFESDTTRLRFFRQAFEIDPSVANEVWEYLPMTRGPIEWELIEDLFDVADKEMKSNGTRRGSFISMNMDETKKIFSKKQFAGHPEWMARLLTHVSAENSDVKALMAMPMWKATLRNHPLQADPAAAGAKPVKALSPEPLPLWRHGRSGDLCRTLF